MQTYSPDQFYLASLDANAAKRAEEDLTKLAAAHSIDIEVAKLAKVYHEKLTFDGVEYASDADQARDAIKMAKAYFAHEASVHDEAKKLAELAVAKLRPVAEEVLKLAAAEGVSVSQLLTAAALQIEQPAKIANVTGQNLMDAGHVPWAGGHVDAKSIHPNAPEMIGLTIDPNLNPKDASWLAHRHLGIDPKDPKAPDHFHAILTQAYNQPGTPIHQLADAYHAARGSAAGKGAIDPSKVWAGGADPARRIFENYLPTAAQHIAEAHHGVVTPNRTDANEVLNRAIGLPMNHPETEKIHHNITNLFMHHNPTGASWNEIGKMHVNDVLHPPTFMQQHGGKVLAGAGAAAGLGGLYLLGRNMHEQNQEKKHRDIVNAYRISHGLPPVEG